MRTAWYPMALMALAVVFVNVPRTMAVPYLMVFCGLALWLVEAESRRRPVAKAVDGLLDHVRIAKGGVDGGSIYK